MVTSDSQLAVRLSSPKSIRNVQSPAFTLVELIVVIAIVALLVSLLVPVVGQARDEAELVKCRARLKNLGLALNLYAENNSQAYPCAQRLHIS